MDRGSVTVGIIILICALLGIGGAITGVVLSEDSVRAKTTKTYGLKVVDNTNNFDRKDIDYCVEESWHKDIKNRSFHNYTFSKYVKCLNQYLYIMEDTSFKVNGVCKDGKPNCIIEANGSLNHASKKIRFAGDVFDCKLFTHEAKHGILLCNGEDSDYLHKRSDVWGK